MIRSYLLAALGALALAIPGVVYAEAAPTPAPYEGQQISISLDDLQREDWGKAYKTDLQHKAWHRTGAQLAQLTLTGSGRSGPGVTFSSSKGAYLQRDTNIGINGSAPGTGTDTKANTLSFWTIGADTNTSSDTLYGAYMFVADNATACEVSNANGSTTFADGQCNTFDSNPNNFFFNFNNSVGGSITTDAIKFAGGGAGVASPLSGRPNHVILTWDTSVAGRWAIYENGVDMRAAGKITATQFVTDMIFNLNNTHGWKLNGTSPGGTGQPSQGIYADVYQSHEYVGCPSALVPDCGSNNTISPTMLKRFYYQGKAVDLGANCTGPTGTQPPICLTGDGDQLLTNKGNATMATLTAAIPYGGFTDPGTFKVFPGPFSFGTGIPPHQATLQYPVIKSTGTTSVASLTFTTNGQPVVVNDFIVVAMLGEDSSNLGTHSPACPVISGWTWTKLQAATPYDTLNSNFQEGTVCTAFAADTTNSFTMTWTGNYTSRVGGIAANYANVGSVDQRVMTKAASNSPNMVVAAGSTTQAQTLLSIYMNWGSSGRTFTPPNTSGTPIGSTRYRFPNQSTVQVMLVDEYGVGAGVSYQRTTAISTTDSWFAASIGLVPN
jgi:hypothetical protein